MKLILLDPGHSGPIEPGAVGPAGTMEADITLQVSEMIQQELPAGKFRSILTRTAAIDDDGLSWRADMANEYGADAFVSIHCNAAGSPAAHGFEVFTTPGATAADALAASILSAIEEAIPELAMRPDRSDGDADKEANFQVLRQTDCPAVLVELAFISNPKEEQLLLNPGFLRRYAKAIALGIDRYYHEPC